MIHSSLPSNASSGEKGSLFFNNQKAKLLKAEAIIPMSRQGSSGTFYTATLQDEPKPERPSILNRRGYARKGFNSASTLA